MLPKSIESKQANRNHFKCNKWFVFHIVGSKNNFNVEMVDCFTKIRYQYNMKTFGTIWNEYNENRAFKNIH